MLVTRMTDSKTAEDLLTTNDVPQVTKPVDPLAPDAEKEISTSPRPKSEHNQSQLAERADVDAGKAD